ncbi:MAG: 50S ribosomal protein L11 methyltransferase [Candidatus Puniceispirillaceae bacterium]
MMTSQSWSIRFETSDETVSYETALTEICGVLAISVSRPYLDAPYWVVEGFCDFAPDEAVVAQALQIASCDQIAPDFSIIAYGERDWLAENRAQFPALHIGRLWVHGAHIKDRPPAGSKALHVEAAEAFGSGTHPTTEGCLRLIDDLLKKTKPKQVLDLGAGSAILAMAIAKLSPSANLIASDIDQIATNTATANRRLNAIAPQKMRCVTSKGFAHRAMHDYGPYDLVVANILAGPLKQMAPEIARHLRKQGYLILSGILSSQERQIRAVYRANGLVITNRLRIGDWSALMLRFARNKEAVS